MRNWFRLSPFFLFILVKYRLKYLLCLFLALVEAIMVGANYYYSEVYSKIPDINMKDKLFWNARNTYWCPCFSTIFHTWIGVDVVHKDLNVLWLYFSYLLGISKNSYRIHRAYKHTTCKSFWKVLLNAFFDYSSCLIGHSQWLKCLQKHRWTFLTKITHHIHRSF